MILPGVGLDILMRLCVDAFLLALHAPFALGVQL